MGGATIGSGGYKYPPLSKVYPPPGGYRGYKLVARGGYKLTYFGVNFRGSKRRKVSQEKILNHECTVWTVICKNFFFFRRHLETRRLLKTRSLLLEVLRQLDTQLTTHNPLYPPLYKKWGVQKIFFCSLRSQIVPPTFKFVAPPLTGRLHRLAKGMINYPENGRCWSHVTHFCIRKCGLTFFATACR